MYAQQQNEPLPEGLQPVGFDPGREQAYLVLTSGVKLSAARPAWLWETTEVIRRDFG